VDNIYIESLKINDRRMTEGTVSYMVDFVRFINVSRQELVIGNIKMTSDR
jgi:hypothetical protein